jgi:hypothetical protein
MSKPLLDITGSAPVTIENEEVFCDFCTEYRRCVRSVSMPIDDMQHTAVADICYNCAKNIVNLLMDTATAGEDGQIKPMRMVEDKDIVPIDVVTTSSVLCDFCGENAPCIKNVRSTSRDGGVALVEGACICLDCATQAARLLAGKVRVLEDGQVDL